MKHENNAMELFFWMRVRSKQVNQNQIEKVIASRHADKFRTKKMRIIKNHGRANERHNS